MDGGGNMMCLSSAMNLWISDDKNNYHNKSYLSEVKLVKTK